MPYYPLIDLASMEPEDSGGGYKTNLLTLGGEDGFILPVFSSMNRFWAFADDYLTGDESIEPSTFPIDPFRLAEMIEPWMEKGELRFLVVNPTAVSRGQWSIEREPIPIAHYCRLVSEIRPGFRQAVREAEARFGAGATGSAVHSEAKEWLKPRIERLIDSAVPIVDEWWRGHGARE